MGVRRCAIAGRTLDAENPTNWDHPLSRGLVLHSQVIGSTPFCGGPVFRDLTFTRQRRNTGRLNWLNTGPFWSANARLGGSGSLVFNGTDSLVTYADLPALRPTAALTYSVWIAVNSLTTVQQALRGVDAVGGADYGFTLSASAVTPGNYLFALKTAIDNLLEAAIPDTKWHLVTATYDGASQIIYVDGVQRAAQAATGAVAYSAGSLLLGGANGTIATLPFGGGLDSFRLHNRSLTAAEPASLYAEECRGSPDLLNWMGRQAWPKATTATGFTKLAGRGGLAGVGGILVGPGGLAG